MDKSRQIEPKFSKTICGAVEKLKQIRHGLSGLGLGFRMETLSIRTGGLKFRGPKLTNVSAKLTSIDLKES